MLFPFTIYYSPFTALCRDDDGAGSGQLGEVFGVDGADAAEAADGLDQFFGREVAVVHVRDGPGREVRGGVEEVFDVAQILASRLGAGAEASFARALEVVPEVFVAAHPDLAPRPGRVARRAARGAGESEEEQLRLLAADEVARVAVRGRVLMLVVEGRGRRVPESLEGAREGLAQLARVVVEGERVVADRHAEVERERALRGGELLGVGADVVEPPRVGLAEPAAQRWVVEAVARDVCVFERGLHVRLA